MRRKLMTLVQVLIRLWEDNLKQEALFNLHKLLRMVGTLNSQNHSRYTVVRRSMALKLDPPLCLVRRLKVIAGNMVAVWEAIKLLMLVIQVLEHLPLLELLELRRGWVRWGWVEERSQQFSHSSQLLGRLL